MSKKNSETQGADSGNNIGKWIAGTSLGVFCLIILLCFCKILFGVSTVGGSSADILQIGKEGFLILGGVVSTVIGYYFGARNGEQAADRANAQADKANEELKAAKEEHLESLRGFNANNR